MNITRYLKKCTHHVSTELQMLTISQNLHIWKASLPPPTHVCTHSLACVVSVTVSPSDCLYQNQQESLRFSWPPKIWLQSLYSCQYFDDKKTRKLTRKHGFLDSYGGGGNRQCLLLQHCWEKLVSYQQLPSRCPPDWPSLIYFIQ